MNNLRDHLSRLIVDTVLLLAWIVCATIVFAFEAPLFIGTALVCCLVGVVLTVAHIALNIVPRVISAFKFTL